MKIVLLLVLLSIVLAIYYYRYSARTRCQKQRPNIQTIPEIVALFPSTPNTVKKQIDQALAQAKSCLEILYAVPSAQRTFNNTMYPLDLTVERFSIVRQALYVVSSASPHDEVRKVSKGASEDSAHMLKSFLGREPNFDAFFKELGF